MLLIANFWNIWSGPLHEVQDGMGKEKENRKGDAGKQEKNYFLTLSTFPPIIRLSSSTFPISALSSRDERTDRRRDEANQS